MQLSLQRDADLPLYRQIVDQIRSRIRTGALPAGYRLPPVRQLAAEYGLTRLTAHSAYSELQSLGLVESTVGRGTFVAAAARFPGPESPAQPPAQWVSQGILAELLRMEESPDSLSFAQAFPAPETYPLRDLGRALRSASSDPTSFGYGPIQGEAGLREGIAGLLLDRGLAVPPDHMLVTSGAQQGIDLALRALVEPEDVVLVEEPTYPGMLELAAQRGQRVVGVPSDAGGLRVDALAAACATYRPRLLYLIPTFSNPAGSTLAIERRAPILDLAATHGMVVLEDEPYGFLGFGGSTPPPLKSDDREEQVVYITSFSKILAPALRLGALVAPPALLPSLAAAKQTSDLVCSALLQRALADYLRRGAMPSHLHHVRTLYRERRDAMLSALQRHMPQCTWTVPSGGLSLWLQLPEGIVERDFASEALQRGVGVAPGRAFFSQPQRRASIRLSFGVHSPQRIEEGMEVLGAVLRSHVDARSQMVSLVDRMAGPLV